MLRETLKKATDFTYTYLIFNVNNIKKYYTRAIFYVASFINYNKLS